MFQLLPIIKEKSIKTLMRSTERTQCLQIYIYHHYTFWIKLILQSLSPHNHFVLCCWNILICQMHSVFMSLSTMLPRLLLEDELNDFCK